jgi:outer membrane protein assembly factor BamB
MPLDQGMGSKKWWVGHEITIKETRNYCQGDAAIGPGAAYVAIQWLIPTPQKSGLLCFELGTGKERWHIPGEFHCVSAGKDFCVATDKQKTMTAYAADDAKVLWQVPLTADLECNPMVAGDVVRIYDTTGTLTTFQIIEKDGKRSAKFDGRQLPLGKFGGLRVMGRQNSCFCFSADGTLYVANGASVFGVKPGPGARPWQWTPPPDLPKALSNLGHPIIARGKLFAVAGGGVVCFEHDEAKKDEGPKKIPIIP